MAKILVIEDEKGFMEDICFILEKKGYETIQAVDGKQGVDMVKEHIPDLVLCDYLLPKKNGFEVLTELKEDRKTSGIPVLFLTVFDNDDFVIKGLDLGAADYISKTTDKKVLLTRIKTHLDLKSKNDILRKMVDDLNLRLGKGKN